MNLSYRNEKNAKAISAFWGKSLDKRDWYSIKSLSEDQTEVIVHDVIGFPWNDASELVREISGITSKEILVRINSPGGDIYDSLSLYNILSSHKSKVITRNESLAASAASILMLAGKERQAYKSSMGMIHEPWTVMAGNQHDFAAVQEVLGKITDNMIEIYSSNSSIGKREWKEKMAQGETWMTSKEMKENGLIDTIIDGKGAKAQFDMSIFANCPECLKGDETTNTMTEKELEKALREMYNLSCKEAKTALALCRKSKGDTISDEEAAQAGMKELFASLEKGISILKQ